VPLVWLSVLVGERIIRVMAALYFYRLMMSLELVWQLRNWAGERQVPNAKYALQHNIGLGGAVVVTLYKKANDTKTEPRTGHNPVSFRIIEVSCFLLFCISFD